jgi:hypothetical protein
LFCYTNGSSLLLLLSSNNSSWDITSGTTIGAISSATWYHVAIVRNGTTFYTFLNGVQGATFTSSASIYQSSNAFIVGTGGTLGANYNAAGYVSNLRVLKGTALYTSAFSPPTAPLTAITNTQLLTNQSNRFVDNSSNALSITPTSTPSVQRFNPFLPTYSQAYSTSVYGGSAYFNGSTDYLTTPSTTDFNFGSNNFTVEFWWNTNQANGNIINPNTGSSWGLLLSAGSISWNNAYNVTSLFNTNASSILNNAWHHVAYVRSSGTIYVYFDGVFQKSNADPTVYTSTASTWNIGNGNVAYFNGYLCDLRVNNGTAVYTSAFTPPTAPLTAITNTKLLLSYQNGAIYDNAMMEDWITAGTSQISTSVKKYGTGSLSFSGASTSYLSTPANNIFNFGAGNFTIEFWVYLNAIASQGFFGQINSSLTASSESVAFSTNSSGQIIAECASGSTQYDITSSALSTSTWYHVAYVRNGSTLTLYINGTSAGTATISTNSINSATTPFTIGRYGDYTSNYFLNGYIDDFRITTGYARYTSNFTPPTAALPNYGSST